MYLEKLVILVKCHKEIYGSAYKITEADAITKDSESQSFYFDVVPLMASSSKLLHRTASVLSITHQEVIL
jgi:hypothetical protein